MKPYTKLPAELLDLDRAFPCLMWHIPKDHPFIVGRSHRAENALRVLRWAGVVLAKVVVGLIIWRAVAQVWE